MFNLQTIKQSFAEPKSLIVFCPLLSTIARDLKIKKLLQPLINLHANGLTTHDLHNHAFTIVKDKIPAIHQWHAIGCLVQMVAIAFFSWYLDSRALQCVGIFPFLEFYTSMQRLTEGVLHVEGKWLSVDKYNFSLNG